MELVKIYLKAKLAKEMASPENIKKPRKTRLNEPPG